MYNLRKEYFVSEFTNNLTVTRKFYHFICMYTYLYKYLQIFVQTIFVYLHIPAKLTTKTLCVRNTSVRNVGWESNIEIVNGIRQNLIILGSVCVDSTDRKHEMRKEGCSLWVIIHKFKAYAGRSMPCFR